MRDPRLIVFLAGTPTHHLDTRCLEIKDGRVHERAIVIAVQTKADIAWLDELRRHSLDLISHFNQSAIKEDH
ncbi:hypothetical protein VSR82_38885 [Burkholderia sp. JPY481]|uniref:hypothetical protein n=1 Tax=unclassified Paraburkholderia TaxID=2615204 RepID=UPI00317CE430